MKEIKYGQESKQKIKDGVDKLADIVSMTMGPKGKTVLIESPYGPQVTMDGVTVAREFDTEDKFEKLGSNLILQSAMNTNNDVGDGTSASIVLSRAMIHEADKNPDINVIKLSEAMDNVAKDVVASLDAIAEAIDGDREKIKAVASLSSKSESVGELVTEVMMRVGKNGFVTLDDSNKSDSYYEMADGVKFDRGLINPYLINDFQKQLASLSDVPVLLVKENLNDIKALAGILATLTKSGCNKIAIIAESFSEELLGWLIQNKIQGILQVIAVNAPGIGDDRNNYFDDLSHLTGATIIGSNMPIDLQKADLTHLGRVVKFTSTQKDTTIIANNDISEYISMLQNTLENIIDTNDRKKMIERIARLQGGIAVIKVGATTEVAQQELKQRYEDSLYATKAAMESGIVPGGGMALYNISLNMMDSDNEIQQVAINIIRNAMQETFKTIIRNSGEDVSSVIKQLNESEQEKWVGFNAVTNKIVDLRKDGIIDPLKVIKTAFLNAVSVSTTYMTNGAAMIIKPEEKK